MRTLGLLFILLSPFSLAGIFGWKNRGRRKTITGKRSVAIRRCSLGEAPEQRLIQSLVPLKIHCLKPTFRSKILKARVVTQAVKDRIVCEVKPGPGLYEVLSAGENTFCNSFNSASSTRCPPRGPNREIDQPIISRKRNHIE